MQSVVSETRGTGYGYPDRWEVRTLLLITVVLAVVVPRLLWHRFLDPFEDGYLNWFIARSLVESGVYSDPISGMTQGNWLPGYHFAVASWTVLFGSHIMPLLKMSNVVFSLATTGVIFLLARPRGFHVAFLAAMLFALNPADIVIASFATPESLILLAVFFGVLLVEQRPLGERRSLWLASGVFLLALSLRYEAWIFVVVYLMWTKARGGLTTRSTLIAMLPSVVFLAGWLAWTAQYGFLPETIIAQTSTDLVYKQSIGALPDQGTRLFGWFAWYFGWTPFALVALAWGLRGERKSAFTAVLFLFYAALVAYTVLDFGNPSARYVHLTIPIVSIFAATALLRVWRIYSRRYRRPRLAGLQIPIALILAISLFLTAVVVTPSPTPGTFTRPMERAGLFLQNLPLPPGKVLVTESSVAAYLSGYPASSIIGSAMLPSDREEAEAFLVEHAAYIVMVTVPYYPLRTLFPEQANGANSAHLVLLFDASGPEYDLGAHRVLVFQVV